MRRGAYFNCLFCNKEFYRKPYCVKHGRIKFCSHTCYCKWYKQGNIKGLNINADFLWDKYIEEGLIAKEIAQLLNCHESTIYKYITEFKLSKNMKKLTEEEKKERHRIYMRNYYRKYPEKNRAHVKKWRKAAPYGVNRKKENRNLSKEYREIIIYFLLGRDGLNCCHCDEAMKNLGDMRIDHIISPLLGGEHRMDNVRLVHEKCNNELGLEVRKALHGY